MLGVRAPFGHDTMIWLRQYTQTMRDSASITRVAHVMHGMLEVDEP
jgi:hypothetical protein